jgi:hypothetical protein
MNDRKNVSTSIAKACLSELVAGAQHRGEVTILERYNKPAAALVPLSILSKAENSTADGNKNSYRKSK